MGKAKALDQVENRQTRRGWAAFDLCPPDEEKEAIPVTIDQTCENEAWWFGRELDWTSHALERKDERELPYPEKLPNRLTLSASVASNHWYVTCKYDGVPLSIVATPSIKCGRMVAKVITIYQYDLPRRIKQSQRADKRSKRRAMRSSIKIRRSG